MSLSDDLPSTEPFPGGYPDVDQPSCQLLGRTALIVQGLMGLFVILSLVFKRHRETPKRPWRIWLFDVSKQIVGQLFVHGANLFVSDLASNHSSSNACVSYFLNILIDTTFGIALIYFTLHALTRLFTEKLKLKGFESGVYGDPPSLKYWARQAAIYVLALTTMKTVVVTILILFPGIYVAGEWLLSWTWTGEGDGLQVVFVMGLFPIFMNVLQFWLIDSIVKASSAGEVALDIEQGNYQDREPLFNAPEDEDDNDHPGRTDAVNTKHSRRSFSSLDSRGFDSHDNLSFSTDPPPLDEHKSSASSSRHVAETHEYPPSLSSSFSSNASSPQAKAPREAKNLMKKTKRREPPTPIHLRSRQTTSPSPRASPSIPQTPSPTVAAVVISQDRAEWGDAWDDSIDWDKQEHQKQNSLTTTAEWNSLQIQRGS
ncbi:hypothetical protein GALMADRAFT_55406 [Galerina marginata CBS 339.88]|uniref:Vacuolar membrane protein n=1 Tax=Galerina marginata (strain CBS 339.88) TaxID=685588 RepID=A0A067TVT9_GALM3|nr:hypothetical protein GALMADRAFT_55406 [Galerina marginata CBS 339.88]